ncbi:integrase catalytic domain-containing protein [Trichonephila clavipes]|nr:integrase catalytic domain-containing protein [Trichonephila clavipes]
MESKGFRLTFSCNESSENCEISLLIGSDFYWSLTHRIKILDSSLVAVKTRLGWSLQGKCDERSDCTLVHLVHSEEESISTELRRFWEIESLGILDKGSVTLGNGDEEILNEFDKSVNFVDGRYRVNLPWKPGMREALQNNKTVARKRFEGLVRRFKCDHELFCEYKDVIDDYVREDFRDRDFTRFFWTDNLNNEPHVLNFTRVLFGLRPSPYLLAATLKHHFKKYREQYPHTFELLNSSIYVDDLICGQNDVPDALRTTLECLQIFSDAGMLLRKWRSNSKQLNLLWQQECVKTESSETNAIDLRPPTKELWTLGVEWDSDLPPKLRHKWQQWSSEAEDASKSAYGTIFYLRFVTCNNEIETSFICSKSRVAPLKSLTLPCLELTAALLSARLAKQDRQLVKTMIRICLVCKKYSAKTADQLSGQLPRGRITQSPPFQIVGIDFTGAILVKDNQGTRKSYVSLFTCAVTRAVHLEFVSDMSTKCFLLALRRFLARRGNCKVIYSDNLLAFKAAERELAYFANIFKDIEFQNFVAGKGIHWEFIVERAPWWGGFYERLVKTIKDPLRKILGRALLTFEELSTILSEVEVIVNHRPLTYESRNH